MNVLAFTRNTTHLDSGGGPRNDKSKERTKFPSGQRSGQRLGCRHCSLLFALFIVALFIVAERSGDGYSLLLKTFLLTGISFFTNIQIMTDKTAISFANVGAAYDGGREVLTDVSFNISAGAFYFLSGASGAGKTTLLRLIYQLHKPSRGQIKLFGATTNDMSRDDIARLRHKMAIVFQEYSLLSHLTVFDNIALPLRVRGVAEDKIKKLVDKVLEWVGLAKYADANPLALSGGQQQRVSVARAIIVQPAILLADEPTGNLDDENASRLMELFIQMNKMFGRVQNHKTILQNYQNNLTISETHEKETCCIFIGSQPVGIYDRDYVTADVLGRVGVWNQPGDWNRRGTLECTMGTVRNGSGYEF